MRFKMQPPWSKAYSLSISTQLYLIIYQRYRLTHRYFSERQFSIILRLFNVDIRQVCVNFETFITSGCLIIHSLCTSHIHSREEFV